MPDISENTFKMLKSVFPISSIVLLACLSTPANLAAQEAKPVEPQLTEPEYANQFFALNPNGTLKPLEHKTPSQAGNSLLIQEERSTVRFAQNRGLTFVIRLTSHRIDPVRKVQFFRLTTQGNQRQLNMTKIGANVPFDAVKYGKASFKIIPKAVLDPGEYGLGVSSTQDGYLFGVDTAATTVPAVHEPTTAPTTSAAQEPRLTEPEYVDTFYFTDSHGDLKPLQRQVPATQNIKPGKTGDYVGIAVLPGANCSVRFPEGSKPSFILRVASRDVDPATTIQFFSLKQQNGHRQIEVHSVAQPRDGTAVPFVAKKYGDFSFSITPSATLAPGEYEITNTMKPELFCFGIDGPNGPVTPVSDGTTLAEPEYDNKYYALSDGKLLPLEHQTLTNDSKSSGVPFAAKLKIFLVVKGAASPVQLSPNTHLVVRLWERRPADAN